MNFSKWDNAPAVTITHQCANMLAQLYRLLLSRWQTNLNSMPIGWKFANRSLHLLVFDFYILGANHRHGAMHRRYETPRRVFSKESENKHSLRCLIFKISSVNKRWLTSHIHRILNSHSAFKVLENLYKERIRNKQKFIQCLYIVLINLI